MRKSHQAGPLIAVAGRGREAWRAAQVSRGCCERYFFTPHTIRGRYYCVKILNTTINATMQAKISNAGSDFRIIGLVELRAADTLG
jgi:hypothetical protein